MSGLTNIVLNPGTGGAILGVDTDGTADYQIVKLGYSDSGTTPVQIGPSNTLPVTVTGTTVVTGTMSALVSFPATQAVSLTGANGTVNVVGVVPVTLGGTFTSGTSVQPVLPVGTFTFGTSVQPVSLGGTFTFGTSVQPVSLTGANGTVNIVGSVPVTLSGANGTVNLVGTAPVQLVGTFTLGTSIQPVLVTGTFTFGTSIQPVASLDQTTAGTISAIDAVVAAPGGGGQMVNGASTAGSIVALNVAGVSAWSAAITGGNFTTTIYFEGSLDSTTGTDGNWISLYGRILGTTGDVNQNNATTNNTFFEGSCGGLKFIRFRAVGGAITTGPTITIRAGTVNTISIGTPLPAGTNNIGTAAVQITGTFTPGTSIQPVSLTGANGTVNIVGTVPVSLTGANGTVNAICTLAGANGTVNIVAGAAVNATPVGTFTFGTSVQPVLLTGANGTVNIVAGAAVNATPVGTFTFGTSIQPVVTVGTFTFGTSVQPVALGGTFTFGTSIQPVVTVGTFTFGTSVQPVSLASVTVNTATNFALETGGNLGTAAASLIYLQQLVELMKQTNGLLQVLTLQIGQMSGQMPDSTADLIDTLIN